MISDEEVRASEDEWTVWYQPYESAPLVRVNTFAKESDAETLVKTIKRILWYLDIEHHDVWSEQVSL